MGKRRNCAPHREQHRVSLLSIPADASTVLYRTRDRILPPAQSGIDRAVRLLVVADAGDAACRHATVGGARCGDCDTLYMSTPTEERPGLALSWQAVLYTHRLPTFLPRQCRRRGGSGLPFSYDFLGDRRKEIGDYRGTQGSAS